MPADPAILKRIRGCPFARGGQVLVRFRADGHQPVRPALRRAAARLRLTGEGDEVILLYPSHRGAGSLRRLRAVAMPLYLALEQLSANPYFLELRQTYCGAAAHSPPTLNPRPSSL